MAIKEIARSLKTMADSGDINLQEIISLSPPFELLLNNFPLLESTVLKNIKISTSTRPAAVTIKGQLPANQTPLALLITLKETSRKPSATCVIQYPEDHHVKLSGLEWFSLTALSIEMASLAVANEEGEKYGGTLKCMLALGDTQIPLTSQYSSSERGMLSDQNSEWAFQGNISSINLTDIASTLLQALHLPTNLPDIAFKDTGLTVKSPLGDFSMQSESSGNNQWAIDLGGKQLSLDQLQLEVSQEGGQLGALVNGSCKLFGSEVQSSISLSDRPEFKAIIQNANFSSIARELLDELNLPQDIPDFSFASIELSVIPGDKEFELHAESFDDWHIPLGITGLDIEDVSCQLSRKKSSGNAYQESGHVSGSLTIAGTRFELGVSFPGEYVFEASVPVLGLSPIIQDLCGAEALMGFPAPSGFLNLTLRNLLISANPQSQSLLIKGESDLGQLQLAISKKEQGQWQFAVAVSPPENWRFSALDSNLSSLDNLGFGNTALIASNHQSRNLPEGFFDLPGGVTISKGLNFIANLDTRALAMDDLMDLDNLSVSAAIGPNPTSMVIAAGIDGTFDISENVAMGNMAFRLQPAPSNFTMGIKGEVLVSVDNSDLVFVGSMSVRPIERSASFASTMLGEWHEPFGIKGFSMADIALDVGIGIVPPPAVVSPIVGLAGSIRIGSFTGSAAVKADTVMPSKSMIAASFNRLYLREILDTFCDPEVMNAIPAELRSTVLQVGMEDVGVHVVPQPTQIGELFYEPGFAFKGKMSIADFDAEFDFKLDYSKGIHIKATMDTINIENVVIITGSGIHPNPLLDVNLMLGEKPGIQIAAAIQIMGISAETLIQLSDQGFHFLVKGNLFDRFEASIHASGSHIAQGGDFYLKVTMRNDLIAYLREEASNAIQEGVNAATEGLSDAQEEVRKAQRAVDTLQVQIDNMRGTVRRERARDLRRIKQAENTLAGERNKVKRLQKEIDRVRSIIKAERARDTVAVRNAENSVRNAQNEVNRLQRNIDNTRTTIRRERHRDTTRLRNAQRDVSNAQREVNKLRGEISSSHKRIRTLQSHIASKKRWVDNSPWFRKVDRGIEFTAYAAAKNAEIGAIYTKIAGIEVAVATAKGALEIAKQVVRGIEKGANVFPIDADPRIIGLFTAKETANLALEAAKQVLRGLQATMKAFPIDADPRIIGLFTAKESSNAALLLAQETLKGLRNVASQVPIDMDPRIVGLFTAKGTATGGLTIAEGALEGIKISIGGLGDAATFIVEQGLGGVFDVKSASFEGQLNVVKGGFVSMALKVELMGNPQSLSLGFNFHDPLSGAKALGEEMLEALK